jgi:nucleosome binding factor SPN SPT16 subunit
MLTEAIMVAMHTHTHTHTSNREAERKELSDLVYQDSLIEIKGRRPPRLPDVHIRPTMEGKKVPGDLEIHVNGLRYQSAVRTDQRQDILFSNIKHLFFQPCDSELIVILHLHLHNPVMVGKKKTKEVQFYREVSDGGFEETGKNARRRMNYGDEDELQSEQEERRRRVGLNKEFQAFAEKISELVSGGCCCWLVWREAGWQGHSNGTQHSLPQ